MHVNFSIVDIIRQFPSVDSVSIPLPRHDQLFWEQLINLDQIKKVIVDFGLPGERDFDPFDINFELKKIRSALQVPDFYIVHESMFR